MSCSNKGKTNAGFGEAISPQALKAHLDFLADDALERLGGRAGEEGYELLGRAVIDALADEGGSVDRPDEPAPPAEVVEPLRVPAGVDLAALGHSRRRVEEVAVDRDDEEVGLGPLAHLVGEPEPGPLTAAAISAWEGLLFAAGTVYGLTRRPRGE